MGFEIILALLIFYINICIERAKRPTHLRRSVDRNAKTRLNLPTHDVVLDPTCRRHHVPLREPMNAAAVRPASRKSGYHLLPYSFGSHSLHLLPYSFSFHFLHQPSLRYTGFHLLFGPSSGDGRRHQLNRTVARARPQPGTYAQPFGSARPPGFS